MNVADLFETMEYGPAPESRESALAWLDQHERQFDLFIDNAWTPPDSGDYLDVVNPATGTPLARVASAGATDVDRAVEAARKAAGAWQALSGSARARHLYALARRVQKHARLFAVLESLDNGKPIRESRDLDIPLVARHFYHHAGWAQLMEDAFDGYRPVGVVGQIIPWNFPLLMLAWKIAPALATGNTVVLKPAPFTPLTALLFAEIAAGAGLPPGVVNIIPGGDASGAALVAHPDIDKIAFTGSTSVGRLIRRETAGSGKRLSLELGGKSPFIVFDDADPDAAVEGLVDAIWFNQGEVCCAGSRLLVQENIADAFLARLRRRMDTLRLGDPLDKGIDLGAVVHPGQRDVIDDWVRRGIDEGATVYQPEHTLPGQGCYYPPTLLTGVSPSSAVVQEEIFGPVLVSMTFRTPAEAVALGNNTRYGLAASIWSENINLALQIAGSIKAGSVWINCTNQFDAASGFGGYRESGFGREGGREGLLEYLRPAWSDRYRPKQAAVGSNGHAAQQEPSIPAGPASVAVHGPAPPIDRTAKLFIAGKQKRPDGQYSRPVLSPDGQALGEVGLGNRKDIRDAVEAARSAGSWSTTSGHLRAQILYYLAENLSARADEFARRIAAQTGAHVPDGLREVEAAIDRLFTYAAWADKFGGAVQETPLDGLVVAVHEPIGVVGIACPDEPALLAFVALVAPAVARGNRVVVIPSERHPLSATDFYQVLETSDVPPGVVNIVTGPRLELAGVLADHDDVDAVWYFNDAAGSRAVEERSTGNMKRTWVDYGQPRDWYDPVQGQGASFLHASVQVKNIWMPGVV